jgi:hypothetical protein
MNRNAAQRAAKTIANGLAMSSDRYSPRFIGIQYISVTPRAVFGQGASEIMRAVVDAALMAVQYSHGAYNKPKMKNIVRARRIIAGRWCVLPIK